MSEIIMQCLREYLIKKAYPELEELSNTQLAEVLGNFYVEARKKRVTEEINEDDPDDEDRKTNCKNTSLRSAYAAFTRYLKHICQIDIRTNEHFIQSNEIFWVRPRITRKSSCVNARGILPAV